MLLTRRHLFLSTSYVVTVALTRFIARLFFRTIFLVDLLGWGGDNNNGSFPCRISRKSPPSLLRLVVFMLKGLGFMQP